VESQDRPPRSRAIPAEIAVWAALVAALVLFGAMTFTTYRSTVGLSSVLRELERIREVENTSARLLSNYRESQSERRAYLLSGDEYFFRQHGFSMRATRRDLVELDSLTRADAEQSERVRELARLLDRADSLGQATIRLRQTSGLEAVADVVRSRAGHEATQRIERAVQTIEVIEEERLSAALDLATTRARNAQGVAIISAMIAVLLMPAAAVIIWRDLQGRRRTARDLRHASRAAEAATRAKSEFLASMSHEIRTPLNGVIGMTELALDTELTQTQRDYLNTARASAESLLRLLNDILDFSKIEAGRLDLESTPFSLRDLLSETLRTLGVRAEQKRLELAYRVAPGVPDILVGDPGRLQQVVVNLVGNAIKFTETGEVVLDAVARPVNGGETELHVTVKDTGIGIPADRIRAVFELFSQADGSTTRRFGGTGLGLTISEQLVKLMGGRIWAESEPGKGSTFHFTARLGVGSQEPLPRATMEQLEGLKVLLLDDHPTNRFFLEEMLTHWRMRPASAASGAEAIALAESAMRERKPFQVGVFDNLLPDTDGYSVAERLAASGALPGSAVIILSSDNQPGNAARRAALRISRALMKPVKQSELLDAILTAAVGSAPVAAPPQAPIEKLRWRLARVLVVEDNVVNQRVAQGLLEKRGMRVQIAVNGREAVELLDRDHAFDLVLMDVEMPEMDGLEASRRIRRHEASKQGMRRIPIVAVTAHAMAEERERCLEAGMDLCLTKPLRSAELESVFDRFLADAASRPAAGAGWFPGIREQLLEAMGGDAELVAAVGTEYLRQTPEIMEQLRRAVANGQAAETARLAHKLKGSSLQLAGAELGQVAGELEDAAQTGDVSRFPELLGRVEQLVEEFSRAVATARESPA
jgi:two-component system, sensor histidine kinase and response regulator